MHILHIPSYYDSPGKPAGPFFHDQAMALHRAGHQIGVLVMPRIEVTLYDLRQNGLRQLRAVKIEDHDGLPVYRMHWGWFPRVMPLVHATLVRSAGLRAFERYVRERGKPDILHAHNTFYGGFLSTQIKARWGIPVVLTEQSTNFLTGRVFHPGQKIVVRHTLKHVDRRFAVGQALADALMTFVPDCPVTFLGNTIDTVFFSPDAASTPDENFTFVVIALLTPRKGLNILLDAFALAFRGQSVCLKIAGQGKQRAELEQQIQRLGLDAQVELVGQLSREEVRQLIRRSHVIVSSSYVETFGVTLIEAMACGKPVVATRSGGPEGFVNEHNGLLVPTGDSEALADAMRRMMAEYDRYDPAAIRAEIVSRFSEQAIARQLEAAYTELLP